MRADDGVAESRGPPAVQQSAEAVANLGQVPEPLVQVVSLLAHKLADVGARCPTRPLDRDDLLDLGQGEPETLCLSAEGQKVQRLGAVHAVARFSALRRGQDARLLVQPQCLPARTAPLRHLTDQQSVSGHDQTIDPAPGGKVKG